MTNNHLVWDTSILRWWVASNATLLKVSFKDLCFFASCFKWQTRIKRKRVNGKFTWSFCYFGNCSTPSSFGGKAVNMIVIRKMMRRITRRENNQNQTWMLIMFHPNYLDQYLSEAGFVLGHLVVGQLVLPREVAQLFNLINLCFPR